MKATTLRKLRQVHNYMGVFFAPAILFFAFTGALQTLGLHESHGDAPPPPRWIAAIANLHKHQVLSGPRRHRPGGDHDDHAGVPDGRGGRAEAVGPGAAPPAGDHDEHRPAGLGALKLFVVAVSAALFATTALGLAIALATRSSRRLSWMLTAAGLALPLALMLF